MPNHLVSEKSPYLLQHAHNPVDWYPWGPEAFEKARREDKPIFLSIGYSTCHWCHVMERESFENQDIAAILNGEFVPVKVDREERPDIDRIYMTFVQASTGSGGWPMSVFLTPDLKPFFGGTYFPPDSQYGRPGFKAVLESLAKAWKTDRAKIDDSTVSVMEQLKSLADPGPSRKTALDRSLLDSGFQYFRRVYDSTNGGFGDAPKFPRPSVLSFLFRYYRSTANDEALQMALHTLRRMAEGGMNDQLGGGFHRYSVDAIWLVPHFEKMLYDQAQLAISYLEAFQITHDAFFANVARNTLRYVLRDMTDPAGGFYSAEDADSAISPAQPGVKSEGAFYLWTMDEIVALLGETQAPIFANRYGMDSNGNVRNDPHGEFTGKNILFASRTIKQVSTEFRMDADVIQENLNRSIEKLFESRCKRPRPQRDDKILTAWNGLMISAFAKAAQVLDEPGFAAAARGAAEFILGRMYNSGSGELLRRYRGGDAAISGFLDDYAFFAQGLLDLYETGFHMKDLEMAAALMEKMSERFEDRENGGFFSTTGGERDLVLRVKEEYDGAEPAGNSVALINLLRLADWTGRSDFRKAAERTLDALGWRIASQPGAAPHMLASLSYFLSPKRQIVLAGEANSNLTRAFLKTLRSRFHPEEIVLLVDSDAARQRLSRWVPSIADMKPVNGKTAAYVCENFMCRLPTSDVGKFEELVQ